MAEAQGQAKLVAQQYSAIVNSQVVAPTAVLVPTDTPGATTAVYLPVEAVATSSTRERRWLRAGSVVHHIIDPRTALPVATDVATACVIARDGVYADAAAKVCIILGATRGVAWLTERQLPGLIYTEDQQVLTTPFLDPYLWEYDR